MSVTRPQQTVFASAARTTTPTAVVVNANGARGVHLVIDVTAVTSTPSVTPTIAGYDALSGKYYTLLVGSAIASTGTTVLKVYPGIATLANGAASDVIPNQVQISMAHGNANSITYSVGIHLIG